MIRKHFHFILTMLAGLFCLTGVALGQGSVTGTLLDQKSGEPLIGVKVILQGTLKGAISDEGGVFNILSVEPGTYTLITSYIGFLEQKQEVVVGSGKANVGNISLIETGVGLDEVNILASVVTDRKTPIAVSTIDGAQVAALVGNQEFPEIMRSTPSIYVTKEGGGFGDSRINVRGFDQRNTAVMLNGIPVNDMENGWVYWSNWAGLSDVTSTIQVQRGLGASKLAVPSIGGSINIVTNPADFKAGGGATFSVGNDGYLKFAGMVSTGLTESGFAATAQVTHTQGNGYIDGTQFQAYSYFLSLSQNIGEDHVLAFTALGAPQWHNQRLYNSFDAITLSTFTDDPMNPSGVRFNPVWGMYDADGDGDVEEFSWRKNFYHKPKVFLNHYWNISDKTSLKSSAYLSFGFGGGTGPRGRVSNDQSFFFDSFSGFGTNLHDANGQTRFTDLAAYNSGVAIADWGEKSVEETGEFENQYVVTSSGDGFIRRASMNNHTWTGILSTLDHKFSENLTVTGGVDARYYVGEHFRRLENLMGADAYLSRSDNNNPANYITEVAPANFGSFYDPSYKNGNNVLNYRNDGVVSWLGLFGQVEYSNDRITTFASFSGSNQGFKRVDYFNYSPEDTPENDIDEDGEYQASDWVNLLGGTAKAGISYSLNEKMNVFVNGGMFSRQPIFDNVFINFRNQVNDNLENQTVSAFEAGYGYRSGKLRGSINVYHTLWGNRQFDESITVLIDDSTQVEGLAVFENVAQLHQGLEVEVEYRPIHQLTLSGMFSLGNWRYTDDFSATITDTDNNQPLGEATIYAKDLKVGDAAQTTANLRATYEVIKGVKVYGQYYLADNLYAPFNVNEDQFFSPGAQVAKVAMYSLLDAGASVEVPLGKVTLVWNLNMNNVLNTQYIAELETSNLEGISTNDMGTMSDAELVTFRDQNFGFYGFGRTWNTSLRIMF